MSPNYILNLIEQGEVSANDIDGETGMRYYPELYYYLTWKQEPFHSYTTVDWLTAFNIKQYIREEVKALNQKIEQVVVSKRNATGELYRELADKQIEDLMRQKRKLQYALKTNKRDELDIKRAKDCLVTDFVEVNRIGFAKCPFHNEKTPSFRHYKHTNSWYCFGCNEGGDVIKLVMKIKDISFVEAVRLLTNS